MSMRSKLDALRKASARRGATARVLLLSGMVAASAVIAGGPAVLAAPQTASAAVAVQPGHSSALSSRVVNAKLLAADDSRGSASPRQGPNTRNGYNGTVQWGQNANGTWYVKTWGLVWNQTGGTSYVYLNASNGFGGGNWSAGSAPYGTTKGVDFTAPAEFLGAPTLIEVTVCTKTSTSWGCGSPYTVISPSA